MRGLEHQPAALVAELADADALARVDGGPEALLRIAERRRLAGLQPLGPMLLAADAQRQRGDAAQGSQGIATEQRGEDA